VKRAELAAVLSGGGAVAESAREALTTGAAYEVWPGTSSADSLLSTYRRRSRHVERTGQPSIGFPEAVERLAASTADRLAIGYVDDRPRGGYYFQVFLDPTGPTLVACLGVKRSASVG
jgi:hypothetical protein